MRCDNLEKISDLNIFSWMVLRGTENAVKVGPLIAHPWCRLWRGAVTAHTLVGVNTNGERVWLNSPDTDKTSEQKCSELTIIYQFCTNLVISAENIYYKINHELQYKINHELQQATSSSTVVFNLFCSIAPLQEVCFKISPHLWF